MDSKKTLIKRINDFRIKGINKINDTKSYLAPRFNKGLEVMIKFARACCSKAYAAYKELEPVLVGIASSCLIKAGVAYRELEPVFVNAATTFLSTMKTGATNLVELVESKFGKIHFDFRHFVMTTSAAVVVFALTFTVTGMGRSKVSAEVLETPEVEAYNNEVIEVNYGDDSAIVDVAKEILADDAGSVYDAKPITLANGNEGYEIGNYVVSVDREATKELKDDQIVLTVQTKETFDKEDFGKVVVNDTAADITKENGTVHTYVIDVKYVDTQAPVINLTQSEVEIDDVDYLNRYSFVESISDNYDGAIEAFDVVGEVPEKDELRWEPGEYTIKYTAKDSSGNVGEASLKVKINATEDEEDETEEIKDALSNSESGSSSDSSSDTGSSVQAPQASTTAGIVYAAAMNQLGVYQDCTMLVTNSLAAAGIYHHGWPASYLGLGTVISASEAVPGDIIYYADGGTGWAHVAVYAGGGQAIHGGYLGNQTVVASAYMGSGPVFIRLP